MARSSTFRGAFAQLSGLKPFQSLSTLLFFPCVDMRLQHRISVIVFSDAGSRAERALPCYLADLLISNDSEGAVFLILSWSSHKSRRQGCSVGSTESLAAGE